MRYISRESAQYIEKAVELARSCSDIEELYEKYYENLLVPWDADFQLKPGRLPSEAEFSCDLKEQVPAALALFYFSKGDLKETIIAAVNYGRDADTIATTAGTIAGAFSGITGIPDQWREPILKANPEPNMDDLCEKLYDVLKKETEAKREQIQCLEKRGLV